MNARKFLICCTVMASVAGMTGAARAEDAPPSLPGSKISFSPLPLEIYSPPGERPAIVFTTPCIQVAKMTHDFPPLIAFENFMLEMIGKVNESGLLPVRLEPVCI